MAIVTGTEASPFSEALEIDNVSCGDSACAYSYTTNARKARILATMFSSATTGVRVRETDRFSLSLPGGKVVRLNHELAIFGLLEESDIAGLLEKGLICATRFRQAGLCCCCLFSTRAVNRPITLSVCCWTGRGADMFPTHFWNFVGKD